MKELTKVKQVSDQQIAFAQKLNLDLRGCSLRVAGAKIHDAIDKEFWHIDLGRPSDKQIAFAQSFGYDIAEETRAVGSAIVADIFEQLDLESIVQQELKPGDLVRLKYEPFGREYIISSIRDDCVVFFKGGNGQRASARNTVKLPPSNS